MGPQAYDVVVIGAGPAGEVVAGRLAQRGLDVAIVEEQLVGGECSYWACMPSKALLVPGHALDEVRRVPGAAQALSGELDAGAALARRDEVIHGLDDSGQVEWLGERGIALVRGRARLDGRLRVAVGELELVARRAVVLASGSRPHIPPIAGLDGVAPWTNREATTASSAPERLAVLGGGPVGCELAQAYASLGSRVWLIEPQERLLAREEEFASACVEAALREGGVDVLTGTEVTSVERTGATKLVTAARDRLEVDEILVAAGRASSTPELGLETAGISSTGDLPVDENFAVDGSDWLYAIGDVAGKALLTHEGKHEARELAELLAGSPRAATSGPASGPRAPRVCFTEPQVAAVGQTTATARDAAIAVATHDADIARTAGASFRGRGVPGPCRLVVDERSDVLIGATFVGVDVCEMLHAATIAVTAELTLATLRAATPAFPTRSEVWLSLLGLDA